MSPLIIGQMVPAAYRSMIFCDESSQKEQFFVLGALYFAFKTTDDHAVKIAKIESQLKALKERYGLFRTVKWTKVPAQTQTNKLEGYKALIDAFLKTEGLNFKCMVLNTKKYPLNNRVRWRGDALVGYLKFYCVFLCDGIVARFPGHFYDITIDNYAFREGYDSDSLRDSVQGRYLNKTQKRGFDRHCDITPANDEDSNILQLTDLLTGAVAFSWNGGRTRTSSRAASKGLLVDKIERHFGIQLGRAKSQKRFSIWEFKAK